MAEVYAICFPSEETRKKLSAAKRGRPGNRRGTTWTEEQRRKLSQARKGRPSPRKGQKCTPATRAKMSLGQKQRFANPEKRKEHQQKMQEVSSRPDRHAKLIAGWIKRKQGALNGTA